MDITTVPVMRVPELKCSINTVFLSKQILPEQGKCDLKQKLGGIHPRTRPQS
jgi:hypothetical protein